MISCSNPRGKCTYFLYPTKHRRPCKDVESFKYSLTKSNYHISLVLTASLVTIIPLEQQVACKEKFPNLTDIWRQASEQKSIWSCGISLPLGIKCRAQLLFFFNIPATKFFISMVPVRDSFFGLVDHPPRSLDVVRSNSHLFLNMENICLGTSIIVMMTLDLIFITFWINTIDISSMESDATPMKEMRRPRGGVLKNKTHLVKHHEFILVSLWKFQPRLVNKCRVYSDRITNTIL